MSKRTKLITKLKRENRNLKRRLDNLSTRFLHTFENSVVFPSIDGYVYYSCRDCEYEGKYLPNKDKMPNRKCPECGEEICYLLSDQYGSVRSGLFDYNTRSEANGFQLLLDVIYQLNLEQYDRQLKQNEFLELIEITEEDLNEYQSCNHDFTLKEIGELFGKLDVPVRLVFLNKDASVKNKRL